jgi:glycine/D-amino acid oxidase-like deaminating enzyme
LSSTILSYDPYWWEGVTFDQSSGLLTERKIDVAVIGGGYTGLSCALTLAKEGHSVAVFEAGRVGFGASGRNGGMLGLTLIPDISNLITRYGQEKAVNMYREAALALEFMKKTIAENAIECDLDTTGRFYPAANQKHLKQMEISAKIRRDLLGEKNTVLTGVSMREEINSNLYVGGVLQNETGSIHPGKYVTGLANACQQAGVQIFENTPITKIKKDGSAFKIGVNDTEISAQKIAVTTNGYHAKLTRQFSKRIIPIGSTVIATAKLDPAMVRSLMPNGKSMADSFKILNYFRPSPDGKRLIIGGRPSIFTTPMETQADILKNRLLKIFPQLGSVEVSHVWSGNVAYGFNSLPHIGQLDDMHFASGYGGSGVALSGYMGHKLALQISGKDEGRTAFDDLPFETRFYYNGTPWFLPLAMIGYQIKDRLGL